MSKVHYRNKNQFAQAPPMGWNSYDCYNTTVTESQVKANADYMASNLKDFGWEYVVVDIQWYANEVGTMNDKFQYIPFVGLEMDDYSRLIPDPVRFPSSADGSGFSPLGDYIHNLGLKFGIHIMRGIPRTAADHHMKVKGTKVTADMIADPSSICGWNPDMYGVRNTPDGQAYYDSLLELYASWGVDFIKCDDICNTNMYRENQYSARHEIEMLYKAIQKCGRDIVLSLSPGPALIEKAWHYEKHANMWRITDDFWDNWDLLKDMFHRCELWQTHVSQGCYPDCDMLPLGRIRHGFDGARSTWFTKEEQKTMMSLWCLFGSPLMLGAELTEMDDWTLSLITNQEVLDMLPPSYRPWQIALDEEKAIWISRNEDGHTAYAAFFNLSEDTAVISAALQELGITNQEQHFSELWTKNSITAVDGILSQEIMPHGCAVFKIV